MRWSLRVYLLLAVGGAGCVGGPVSDWPGRNHDDDDGAGPATGPAGPRPGSNAGESDTRDRLDAGLPPAAPPDFTGGAGDGGSDASTSACSADAGACRAACDFDAGLPSTVGAPVARFGCSDEAALAD